MSQPNSHEMSLRDLNQISNERDISETSQKHLKRDDLFVTCLKRLKNISKNKLVCDVFKTSWTYIKKGVYSVAVHSYWSILSLAIRHGLLVELFPQIKNAWYASAQTWNKTWKNTKAKRQKTKIKV